MSTTSIISPHVTTAIEIAQRADDADQYAAGFAARWDELVDWERREQLEAEFLASLLPAAGDGVARAPRVLDMACGTGFHAALLARSGHDVTAADGSAEMVEAARTNLGRLGLDVPVAVGDWEQLAAPGDAGYDAVVCLGSSIPHADPARRVEVLRRVHDALAPGGTLVLDHRNFDHIVEHGQMPPGRSVYGGAVQVELVDADAERTVFGYRYPDGFYRTLTIASLRFDDLRADLVAAGFDRVESFGDQRPVDHVDDSGFFMHRAVRAPREPEEGDAR